MRAAERGFSLVEAIVATGLLAGAIAALAHLLTVCAGTNALAGHLTMAAIFAQRTVEELRSEPVLNDVARTVEYLDADGSVMCRGAASCAGAVYLREWSVESSTVVPTALFVRVRVRQVRLGAVRNVNLVTVRPRIR
jgi:hypothetical protein